MPFLILIFFVFWNRLPVVGHNFLICIFEMNINFIQRGLKKNQLDVTFCILYFSSNSCSTCFGQPCAYHQELTTAWCYSLVLVCAVVDTTRTPPQNKPDIYQLKCNTCNLSYIGQTSRNLKTRYNEHVRYIKNNNPQSAYAHHILNNRHEFGTIESTMTLLKPLHNQH